MKYHQILGSRQALGLAITALVAACPAPRDASPPSNTEPGTLAPETDGAHQDKPDTGGAPRSGQGAASGNPDGGDSEAPNGMEPALDATEEPTQPSPPPASQDGSDMGATDATDAPTAEDLCEPTLSCERCVLHREGVEVGLELPPDLLSQMDEIWLENVAGDRSSCTQGGTMLWPGSRYPVAYESVEGGAVVGIGPVRVQPDAELRVVFYRDEKRIELTDIFEYGPLDDGDFGGGPFDQVDPGEALLVSLGAPLPGDPLWLERRLDDSYVFGVDKSLLPDVAGIWAIPEGAPCDGLTGHGAHRIWPTPADATVIADEFDRNNLNTAQAHERQMRVVLPTDLGSWPTVLIVPKAGRPLTLARNVFDTYELDEGACAPLHLLPPPSPQAMDCDACVIDGGVVVPVELLDAVDELWVERDSFQEGETCQRDRQRLWPPHAGALLAFDTGAAMYADLPMGADPTRLLPPGGYARFVPETLYYRSDSGEARPLTELDAQRAPAAFGTGLRLVAVRSGERVSLPIRRRSHYQSAHDLWPDVDTFPGGQCITCRDCPNGCLDHDALFGDRSIDFLVVPPELARVPARIQLLVPLGAQSDEAPQCLRANEPLQVWPPALGTETQILSYGEPGPRQKHMLRIPIPFDVPEGTRALIEDLTGEDGIEEVELPDLDGWNFTDPLEEDPASKDDSW